MNDDALRPPPLPSPDTAGTTSRALSSRAALARDAASTFTRRKALRRLGAMAGGATVWQAFTTVRPAQAAETEIFPGPVVVGTDEPPVPLDVRGSIRFGISSQSNYGAVFRTIEGQGTGLVILEPEKDANRAALHIQPKGNSVQAECIIGVVADGDWSSPNASVCELLYNYGADRYRLSMDYKGTGSLKPFDMVYGGDVNKVIWSVPATGDLFRVRVPLIAEAPAGGFIPLIVRGSSSDQRSAPFFQIQNGSRTPYLTVTTLGHVGIGINNVNPNRTLSIDHGNIPTLGFSTSGIERAAFLVATDATLRVEVGNAEALRVAPGGLVGVGNVAPSAQLHVRIGGNGARVGLLATATATMTTNFYEWRDSSGNLRQALAPDGNLLLGTNFAGVRSDTASGNDHKTLYLSGGGSHTDLRGARITLSGNQSGTPGLLDLRAGDITGSVARIEIRKQEVLRADPTGMRVGSSAGSLGFYGGVPRPQQSLAADATDLTSAIALINDLKEKLISLSLFTGSLTTTTTTAPSTTTTTTSTTAPPPPLATISTPPTTTTTTAPPPPPTTAHPTTTTTTTTRPPTTTTTTGPATTTTNPSKPPTGASQT